MYIGDRAEGAEATLEAGLNKLTLAAAEKEDSGDEQDPHYTNPELSSPGPATATILLLNSV